ncbi:hypothetical protein ATG98_1409 [Marinobacter sp. LV10R520-4]|uniref:hypothetical protein n=1 Tax=Marinobacter sp. LV10R520-4 TaxID=1761796 RepID=UPI000BF540D0|nr:hypothetical protein [Marinobacter sp. LV10R520-4]PFG52389.1 hypothetical protein ATG98_1409 [Marinobacter sp. LV10R520-4]
MLDFFKKTSKEDINQVKRALGPDAIVVVSASCCMPGTSQVDEEIEATARNALAETTLDWPVITITVTTAQSILPKISAELSVKAGELASQVSELFMTHGLSAFPIIIVDQTLVSYGGAPDQAMILNALSKATETKKDAALQGIQ